MQVLVMSSAPFFWLFCLFLALNNHQSICCSFRDSCYGVGNWRWIIIVLYQLLVADDDEEEEEELILCLLVRFFLSFFLAAKFFCHLRLSSLSLRMLKLLGSSSSVLSTAAFVIVIADA